MKNLKKLVVSLFALALTFGALGFASCKNEETPPAPPANENTPTEYVFPQDDATIVWKNIRYGDGSAFNRFEASEGYYKISIEANQEVFYSFSASQTGLYALYTMSAVEGVTITQYDATSQYIPIDDNGNFIGNEAVVVPAEYGDKAGVLYSKVNCSAKYYSDSWRATYGFESTTAQTVEVRFVRIGDALREPENVVTSVTPSELKGAFLSDPNQDTTGKDVATVPFSSKYFYDEDYEIEVTPFAGGQSVRVKGFYRMGTEEKPGDLIYVMLTKSPVRMFDTTFIDLVPNGASLRLFTFKAENGDIHYNDYENFIMKGTGDATKVCYENAVNSDGLYPVNQELFDFLNYYVDARGCAGMSEDQKALYPDAMWLAPCYYYGNASDGTQAYPYRFTLGVNEITLQKENYVYYKAMWEREQNTNTNTYINDGYYRIICDNPDVTVKFMHDATHTNYTASNGLSTGIQFETDAYEGVTLMLLYTGNSDETTVNITVEKVSGGYLEKPLTASAGTIAMTTLAWLNLDGKFEYSIAYAYTATKTGTVTVSAPIINGELTANDTVVTTTAPVPIQADAGDVITIVYTSNGAQSVSVSISEA